MRITKQFEAKNFDCTTHNEAPESKQSVACAAPGAKAPFPAPAPLPSQQAANGKRFDFNLGCRVALPAGDWRVRLTGKVINYHACNSCWNDPRVRFDHSGFLWCPRHAGTPRQFECTRLITATQVKSAIRRLPTFVAPSAACGDD